MDGIYLVGVVVFTVVCWFVCFFFCLSVSRLVGRSRFFLVCLFVCLFRLIVYKIFQKIISTKREKQQHFGVVSLTCFRSLEGTGKTVTGVHIAYWFVKQNMQQQQDDLDIVLPDIDDQPKGPQNKVIYCGPSNKSVDVVASKCKKVLITI